MKKVFMSLAAIAFVAMGSLTVTSCGSDDSTTTPEPPTPPTEQADNTIRYQTDDFEVNYQQTGVEYMIYNKGTEDEFAGPKIYTSSTNPGVAYQAYTQLTTKIVDDALTDYVNHTYYIINPTVQFATDGSISSLGSILSPSQVESEMELKSAGVRLGGTVLHNALGTLNEGHITYDTYQVGDEVEDSEQEFEYASIASYDSNIVFADGSFTIKTSNLAGFFFATTPEAKLPTFLMNKLNENDKAQLIEAMELSLEKSLKDSNLKAFDGKVLK